MISTDTWWETIFSGALSIGINEEKIHLLEDEAFLYFSEDQLPQEQQNNDNELNENLI